MSTTPSEADKRAAESVAHTFASKATLKEWDAHVYNISQIIADHHQPEREAFESRIKTLSDIIRGRVEHSNHCHSRDPEDTTCTCGLYHILKGLD